MPAYFMPDFAPFSGAALACRRQKAYSYDENVLPSPSSASSHMYLHEDSDAAQEILAQLAEAKRACESLERELELERQAGMFNLPKKKGCHETGHTCEQAMLLSHMFESM